MHCASTCSARQGEACSDSSSAAAVCRVVACRVTCSRRDKHLQLTACRWAGRGRLHPEERSFWVEENRVSEVRLQELGALCQTQCVVRRDYARHETVAAVFIFEGGTQLRRRCACVPLCLALVESWMLVQPLMPLSLAKLLPCLDDGAALPWQWGD